MLTKIAVVLSLVVLIGLPADIVRANQPDVHLDQLGDSHSRSFTVVVLQLAAAE
jgi:hypothetical protein